MAYPLNPALMELLILSMIRREDSYGYQISQNIKKVSNLKDSALYPVLRRLAENFYVDIYDRQFQGRNRKYYRITEMGKRQQALLEQEWKEHVAAVNELLDGCHEAQDAGAKDNEKPQSNVDSGSMQDTGKADGAGIHLKEPAQDPSGIGLEGMGGK